MTSGTTSRIMKRILDGLKEDELIPLPRLAEKIDMSESNLRRSLYDMEDIGLVKKEILPLPTRTEKARLLHKPCLYGWRKAPLFEI
jgi:DNA-binding Lrp family transcriptional regulator